MDLSSLLTLPANVLLWLLIGSVGSGPTDDSVRPPSPSKPARKTWTAADLAALSGHGVSVSGSRAEPATNAPLAQDAAAHDGSVLAKADVPAIDWSARARALRESVATNAERVETIDELSEQWGNFVLATGQNQAVAAHELGRLREARLQVADALSRAQAELLALEEAARKSGVPPGELR